MSTTSSITPVAASASALNALFSGSPGDGQQGAIRLGSGQDTFDVELVYNANRAKWVGGQFIAVRSSDQAVASPVDTPYTTKQLLGGTTPLSSSASLEHAGAGVTAGMSLEYKHNGFLLGNDATHGFNSGVCFYQFNSGDNTPTYHTPPNQSDLIAETAYLHGGVNLIFQNSQWTEIDQLGNSGWQTLHGPAPTFVAGTNVQPTGTPAITKSVLYPRIYGFMDNGYGGSTPGGSILYTLYLRWVI
jgi:hypothetical protein